MPVASCTETNKDPKTAERPSERDRTDQSAGFPVVAADCIGRALLRYLASFVSSRFDYGRSRTRPNQLAAHPRVLRPDPMCSTSKPFSYFSLSLSLFFPLSFFFVSSPPRSSHSIPHCLPLLATIYTFTVIRAQESFAQSVLISRLFINRVFQSRRIYFIHVVEKM